MQIIQKLVTEILKHLSLFKDTKGLSYGKLKGSEEYFSERNNLLKAIDIQ